MSIIKNKTPVIFTPTDDMVQLSDGTWRWKAGTINPSTGVMRVGQPFVKGAPSPNEKGTAGTRNKENRKKYLESILSDIEMRLSEMAVDPTTKNGDLIAIYKFLYEQAYGKALQQTEVTVSNNNNTQYKPMMIGSNIVDKVLQETKDQNEIKDIQDVELVETDNSDNDNDGIPDIIPGNVVGLPSHININKNCDGTITVDGQQSGEDITVEDINESPETKDIEEVSVGSKTKTKIKLKKLPAKRRPKPKQATTLND